MIFIDDGEVRIATLCSAGDWSFVATVLATKVSRFIVGDWSVVGTVLVAEVLLTQY
jgi:hypothetical protein